ncbi:hypothetical protein QTP88_013212 [Uroleucon formosanum]
MLSPLLIKVSITITFKYETNLFSVIPVDLFDPMKRLTPIISMSLFVIIVYPKNKICSKLYLKYQSSPGLNLCGTRLLCT